MLLKEMHPVNPLRLFLSPPIATALSPALFNKRKQTNLSLLAPTVREVTTLEL